MYCTVHKIIFNFFIVILLRENKQFDSERRWQKHVINFRSCFSVLLYIMIIFSIYILFVQFLALVWRIMWFFEIKLKSSHFLGKYYLLDLKEASKTDSQKIQHRHSLLYCRIHKFQRPANWLEIPKEITVFWSLDDKIVQIFNCKAFKETRFSSYFANLSFRKNWNLWNEISMFTNDTVSFWENWIFPSFHKTAHLIY